MHIPSSMYSATPLLPDPPEIIFATCASYWLTNPRTIRALPATVNSRKSSFRPAASHLQTASKRLNPLLLPEVPIEKEFAHRHCLISCLRCTGSALEFGASPENRLCFRC